MAITLTQQANYSVSDYRTHILYLRNKPGVILSDLANLRGSAHLLEVTDWLLKISVKLEHAVSIK